MFRPYVSDLASVVLTLIFIEVIALAGVLQLLDMLANELAAYTYFYVYDLRVVMSVHSLCTKLLNLLSPVAQLSMNSDEKSTV